MCTVDFDDDDETSLWRVTTPTARSQHWCDVCGCSIEGIYLRTSWVNRGYGFSSEAACYVCGAIWRAFTEEHGAQFNVGQIEEQLRHCIEGTEWRQVRRWGTRRSVIAEGRDEARFWRDCLAVIERRRRTVL